VIVAEISRSFAAFGIEGSGRTQRNAFALYHQRPTGWVMPAVHHAMLTARLPCRRLEAYRSRLDPELMDVTMQTPPLDPDVADTAAADDADRL
jgi:hypothetical protein